MKEGHFSKIMNFFFWPKISNQYGSKYQIKMGGILKLIFAKKKNFLTKIRLSNIEGPKLLTKKDAIYQFHRNANPPILEFP